MKIQKIDDHVRLYKGALSKKWCEHIIKRFEDDTRKINYNGTYAQELRIQPLPEWLDVIYELREVLTPVAKDLIENAYPDFLGNKTVGDAGYRINKTVKGESYGWHTDIDGPQTVHFQYSVIIYLNTVEGGETEFYYQKHKVKPKQGDILIFPPFWTHRHRGLAPKSDKYTVLTAFTI